MGVTPSLQPQELAAVGHSSGPNRMLKYCLVRPIPHHPAQAPLDPRPLETPSDLLATSWYRKEVVGKTQPT